MNEFDHLTENEFNKLSKAELRLLRNNLFSYKQGCADTFKLISDIEKNTLEFYEQKISYITRLIEEGKDER